MISQKLPLLNSYDYIHLPAQKCPHDVTHPIRMDEIIRNSFFQVGSHVHRTIKQAFILSNIHITNSEQSKYKGKILVMPKVFSKMFSTVHIQKPQILVCEFMKFVCFSSLYFYCESLNW